MAFIGRDDDLKQLQECFTERRAQLVFVYGRRRVVKTETLIQLAKDKETYSSRRRMPLKMNSWYRSPVSCSRRVPRARII